MRMNNVKAGALWPGFMVFALLGCGQIGESSPREQELVQVLQTGASWEAMDQAFRELQIIGTQQSIPVLAKYLEDERWSHLARIALEQLPTPPIMYREGVLGDAVAEHRPERVIDAVTVRGEGIGHEGQRGAVLGDREREGRLAGTGIHDKSSVGARIDQGHRCAMGTMAPDHVHNGRVVEGDDDRFQTGLEERREIIDRHRHDLDPCAIHGGTAYMVERYGEQPVLGRQHGRALIAGVPVQVLWVTGSGAL